MSLKALEGGNTSPKNSVQTTKTIKSKQTKTTIEKKSVEIGHKEYIDAETGEVRDFRVISMEDKDFNFQKIWLGHILEAINEFGNAKMEVLMYLIARREKANNMIAKTIREISKETGISLQTITDTLKILEKHNVIKRKTGIVFLNPDVIFKGSSGKRMSVLLEYHGIEDDEKEITRLQKEARKHQDKKKKEHLNNRKAELLTELEELQNEIEEE